MHSQDGPVPLRQIAERQKISHAYLEQLMSALRQAGVVRSVRGARGGYQLTHPATETKVSDVLNVLEGSLAPTDCVEREKARANACEFAGDCAVQMVWRRMWKEMKKVIDTTTIADLCNKACE